MKYDVAIIGTGCAGLSAGIYSVRYGMKTVVFGELPGGLITSTHIVENYPGLGSLSGMEMGQKFIDHAEMIGVEMKYTKVIDIKRDGDEFILNTRKEEFRAKTVVIATGSEHRKLNAKGEERFANKGVSYCATCDAAFYKDKVVAIIGGADSAAKEALLLSEIASTVYMIYRKKDIRPEPINKDRVMANPKIEVLTETEVEEFVGESKLEKVIFKNGKGELALDGAFIAVGHLPQTELAQKLGVGLDSHGAIIINGNSETDIPGVYAAGDVTNTDFNQAIISAAEGCHAAKSAYEFVSGK